MARLKKTLTEDQAAQVEGLASVLSQDQMSDYFGISRPTFAAIMEREPEIALLYKRGRAKAIGAVAQGLLQRARDGDTASAIFFLKTQAGWRETNVLEHTGKDGGPIQHEDVARDADQFTSRISGLAASAAAIGNGETVTGGEG